MNTTKATAKQKYETAEIRVTQVGTVDIICASAIVGEEDPFTADPKF